MTEEVRYDTAHEAEVIQGRDREDAPDLVSGGDGMCCHAGADQMQAAARAAGQSEILDRYA